MKANQLAFVLVDLYAGSALAGSFPSAFQALNLLSGIRLTGYTHLLPPQLETLEVLATYLREQSDTDFHPYTVREVNPEEVSEELLNSLVAHAFGYIIQAAIVEAHLDVQKRDNEIENGSVSGLTT